MLLLCMSSISVAVLVATSWSKFFMIACSPTSCADGVELICEGPAEESDSQSCSPSRTPSARKAGALRLSKSNFSISRLWAPPDSILRPAPTSAGLSPSGLASAKPKEETAGLTDAADGAAAAVSSGSSSSKLDRSTRCIARISASRLRLGSISISALSSSSRTSNSRLRETPRDAAASSMISAGRPSAFTIGASLSCWIL
mmetsp:Transcript_63095/g.150406  ORF Transcript_63095/g.150406 Transcript_63095/m.150406 type:complete len:201 (+) Transcript_63095:150-752(+)